jgi:hypothetical protein
MTLEVVLQQEKMLLQSANPLAQVENIQQQ